MHYGFFLVAPQIFMGTNESSEEDDGVLGLLTGLQIGYGGVSLQIFKGTKEVESSEEDDGVLPLLTGLRI